MNRILFYNKLEKYKREHQDALTHSEYGSYYNKIDNYYGPGKARYFKDKEEWDAYQREKEKMFEKAKADVAKRDVYNAALQSNNTKINEINKGIKENRNKKLESNLNSREAAAKKGQDTTRRQQLLESNVNSREAAMKAGQKSMMDETKKYREEIERQKAEELNNWKKEKKDEVNNEFNKIYNAMKNIDGKNNKSLNIDNEYIDLIKEKVAEKDPDFNGDLDKYVTPVDNDNWFLKAADFLGLSSAASVAVKTLDDAQNIQEKHIKLVKGVLNELEDMIDNEIDSTTYEDERYDSYLNKLKKTKSEKKDKAITKDINTARLSLKKMYDGDSKNLDLDPSLMKALNDKLAQMDEEYNGNLYKYVRPYLFNTWIKDEESYDIVKKALDEIEKELRTANKNNEDYGEYIDKVSKILEA